MLKDIIVINLILSFISEKKKLVINVVNNNL